jgi:hypothetical protein
MREGEREQESERETRSYEPFEKSEEGLPLV